MPVPANLAFVHCNMLRLASSKRLRQAGLPKNGVGGVPARNAHRHREISLGYRAVPDFMAAFALPDEQAAGGTQSSRSGLSN